MPVNEVEFEAALERARALFRKRLKKATPNAYKLFHECLFEVARDPANHRERMIQAIMDRHYEKDIASLPDSTPKESLERHRQFVETYRPYAAADVDAIIAVLKAQKDTTATLT